MSIRADFSDTNVAQKPAPTSPFCLRLTDEERALLAADAKGKPLGRYIRDFMLAHRAQKRRVYRKPKINDALLGQVLAALGRSHLSSNLNQIAKAANIGTLPLTSDVVRDIEEACTSVAAMRKDLVEALGLLTEGEDK